MGPVPACGCGIGQGLDITGIAELLQGISYESCLCAGLLCNPFGQDLHAGIAVVKNAMTLDEIGAQKFEDQVHAVVAGYVQAFPISA